MKIDFLIALLVAIFLPSSILAQTEITYRGEPAFGPLKFVQPLGLVSVPGRKDELLVVEKCGQIQRVKLRESDAEKTQILDVSKPSDGVFEQGGECGLLGAALHPEFDKNPYLFVYYSLKINGKLHQRVSRFKLADITSLKVVKESEQPVITQLDSASNHNGGDLHFGPDGYLYISCGDGGQGDDRLKNSGDIMKGFHAALYRIDVDKRPGNLPPNSHPSVILDDKGGAFYAVPADNPFVTATTCRGVKLDPSKVRTETWAIGLRNPWRFSFDPPTGRIFTGDVGQNLYEEIDIIVPGGDYGWNNREGSRTFNQSTKKVYSEKNKPNPNSGYIEPIHDYEHKEGISVTGGCVYRGETIPSLKGAYIFADYGRGWLKALREVDGVWTDEFLYNDVTVTGFGFDPRNGDILYTSLGLGEVRRLTVPKKLK
jgi:glucose/arabinose dehydrogenase